MSVSGSDRATRAAKSQSVFRAGNERLKSFNEDWYGIARLMGEWICECANDNCVEHIEMTSSEYEAIRQRGDTFLVAPGEEHVWPDIEQVIERHDHYWIVKKTGLAQELVTRADPRLT